jgi:hypothetical protein
MAKKKRSRPEQLKIAGTERIDGVPELEDLAEQYRDVTDQCAGLREEKHNLAELLVEKLQEIGKERHIYEGRDGLLHEISIEELDVKVIVRRHRKPRPEAATPPPSPASN